MEVGQRVAAGTPLMAVVPLEDVWVDANFKEVQLQRMRAGQPVAVEKTPTVGCSIKWAYKQASGEAEMARIAADVVNRSGGAVERATSTPLTLIA